MAHLLWNSAQDSDSLVDEWMHGVYGAAYKPMRQWFDLLHAKVKTPDRHLHIFAPVTSYFLTPEVLATGGKLFDEADSRVAADDPARYYIAKSRLCLRYVKLMQHPDEKALDEFVADLPKFDISQLREGQPRQVWEKSLRDRLTAAKTRPAAN